MSTTTREEWLASLKAGDQVAIRSSFVGYEVHDVAKRTPSGQIVLKDGTRFDKTGYEMRNIASWNKSVLYEVTPQVLSERERRRLRNDIDRLLDGRVLDRLSNERLEELLAVLRKQEVQG